MTLSKFTFLKRRLTSYVFDNTSKKIGHYNIFKKIPLMVFPRKMLTMYIITTNQHIYN